MHNGQEKHQKGFYFLPPPHTPQLSDFSDLSQPNEGVRHKNEYLILFCELLVTFDGTLVISDRRMISQSLCGGRGKRKGELTVQFCFTSAANFKEPLIRKLYGKHI